MQKIKYCILGSGISGIGANIGLDFKGVIFEQNEYPGGLTSSFIIQGFTFDNAIHLSFSKIPLVIESFYRTKHIMHKPTPVNFYKYNLLPNPLHYNLKNLKFILKVRILVSKLTSFRYKKGYKLNYLYWNYFNFGRFFTNHFIKSYHSKYWRLPMIEMGTNWISNRIKPISFFQMLKFSFVKNLDHNYYANEMKYPENGGYFSFISNFVSQSSILLNHKVININPQNKTIQFSNGLSIEYEYIISSIPLPVLFKVIDCDLSIKETSEKLKWTKLLIISIGFRKVITFPSLWFYVYDQDVPFARAYSPSLKSPYNAPKNCSSIQLEIYFDSEESINVDQLIPKSIASLKKIIDFDEDDVIFINSKVLPFGNVTSYENVESDKKILFEYLKSVKINSIGRFGQWEYFWSDQSFMSGYEVGKKILNNDY
jgi:protoporphyrinogen oxidase